MSFDESDCYCNSDLIELGSPKLYNLPCCPEPDMGCKVLENMFAASLKYMTAVTDRHNAYFALHILNHQVCLVNLLRELQDLNELDKDQWLKQAESLFVGAIHTRKERSKVPINSRPWVTRLDNKLKQSVVHLKKPFG